MILPRQYEDVSASEIAKLCGFVDASSFAQHFRKRIGMTPTEYRERMGHVWLGFSESQVTEWLQGAGFSRIKVVALPRDPGAKAPALFVATGIRRQETGDRKQETGNRD